MDDLEIDGENGGVTLDASASQDKVYISIDATASYCGREAIELSRDQARELRDWLNGVLS